MQSGVGTLWTWNSWSSLLMRRGPGYRLTSAEVSVRVTEMTWSASKVQQKIIFVQASFINFFIIIPLNHNSKAMSDFHQLTFSNFIIINNVSQCQVISGTIVCFSLTERYQPFCPRLYMIFTILKHKRCVCNLLRSSWGLLAWEIPFSALHLSLRVCRLGVKRGLHRKS